MHLATEIAPGPLHLLFAASRLRQFLKWCRAEDQSEPRPIAPGLGIRPESQIALRVSRCGIESAQLFPDEFVSLSVLREEAKDLLFGPPLGITR